LPQAFHTFVRRIDLRSGLSAGLVARGDVDAGDWLRTIAARRRAGEAGLIIAPAPDDAWADPDAFDATLKLAGHDPRSVAWQIADRAIDRAGLHAVARLRARGWAFELVTAPGEAPALAARDRTLFASLAVVGDWTEALACEHVQRRLRAAGALGLQCVWAGVGEPRAPRLLCAEGYDARDGASRYPTEARANSAGPALSFSSR